VDHDPRDVQPVAAAVAQETSRLRRALLVRLGLVIALVAVLLTLGYVTGLGRWVASSEFRAYVLASGGWGVALYLALFTAGELLHVPGMAFVAAGVLCWGRVRGGLYAYLAAVIAMTLCFVLVRAVGGKPLAEIKHPRARALLAHLDRRPVTTVLFIRLLTWMAPSATYALALSSVRTRAYVVGTALGLAVPIGVMAGLMGVLFNP
jgi:uncharacterized membrane protein YdjX (TVP38/TMEM64 family)